MSNLIKMRIARREYFKVIEICRRERESEREREREGERGIERERERERE